MACYYSFFHLSCQILLFLARPPCPRSLRVGVLLFLLSPLVSDPSPSLLPPRRPLPPGLPALEFKVSAFVTDLLFWVCPPLLVGAFLPRELLLFRGAIFGIYFKNCLLCL